MTWQRQIIVAVLTFVAVLGVVWVGNRLVYDWLPQPIVMALGGAAIAGPLCWLWGDWSARQRWKKGLLEGEEEYRLAIQARYPVTWRTIGRFAVFYVLFVAVAMLSVFVITGGNY